MIHVDNALWLLMEKDPTLNPYAGEIRMHLDRFNDRRWQLNEWRNLSDFANGHRYFGFHRTGCTAATAQGASGGSTAQDSEGIARAGRACTDVQRRDCSKTGWVFREWLPGADAAWLTGDFNYWAKWEYPLQHIGGGVWEIYLDGWDRLKHGQFIKLLVGREGTSFERIPAYMTRCVMDMSTETLCGQIWMPDEPFEWTDGDYFGKCRPDSPMIYEAHIGMAQEHGGIGSYREFADNTLPWIQGAGYNTVQLMAIQEHPYYASFGYQVTNFFAPSHRYGTPEDLKYLINKAHGMGLSVLLDVVHSHACPNPGEGLNQQDGTNTQYFHDGERGWHAGWKTRIFDYSKHEVLHFLLSNLKYWMEEFHFDGFRFDGVTSIMYEDHGLNGFSGYPSMFSMNTNVDGRVYLMLANELIHGYNPKAMTIAEDVSAFPGMCLPLEYGGVGFDYRLAMGIPDAWIKLVKDMMQDDWDMHYLWRELNWGRPGEMSIGYAESHDQAMVGDQSLMFRLAGAEMYDGMAKDYHSPTMDRAIDMHKVIRFLTCATAGNGYLNFMGNEFGHPEWIDFPREGNNWSYHYARRQWSLAQNWSLKFDWLAAFDRGMTYLMNTRKVHCNGPAESLWIDNERKLLIFERGGLLYAFNLHPTWSQESVFVNCRVTGPGGYKVVLSTDDWPFGGQSRTNMDQVYHAEDTEFGYGIRLYLPCRCGVALQKVAW